ncbi:MAG TPA: aldehyde dehydrogenase family protein [Gaiellaceae bacterium]|jgi:succinate-semialdehyde dehydrogenase/glutarate-semialdehyde dehydrogenase
MAVSPPVAAAGELVSLDPVTLEPVGSVRRTAVEEIPGLVVEARLAQARWADTQLAARSRLLADVAQVVLDRMDEIAVTLSAEVGKPPVEAYTTELIVALDHLVWLARNAGQVLRPERLPMPQLHLRHKRAHLLYEPYGVIGVIAPWNFPFSIPLVDAATAVVAGNAVVVKPSELTPLSGEWVERVFAEAGAPAGLVRVIQGEGETIGEALVRARGLDKLFFTGSTEVGRRVAALAGERLCPVTLELGGKDPMLVFADADLERAVAGALWGAFFNCGQACTSVERIYVEAGRYDEFVTRLVEAARSLRIGQELGPLVSSEERERVEALVAEALDDGADVVTGGRRPQCELPGWFHEPTVITGVPEGSRIDTEELFGPVVTVARFDSEAQAVEFANASPYGLGASVWTSDAARASRLAARLEAGMVWVNDVSYSFGAGQASWGGVKQSGFGRTHSKHGLYECVRVKYADGDAGRMSVAWWFPYEPGLADGFHGLLGVLYGRGLAARVGAAWTHRLGLLAVARRSLRR